MIAQVTPQGNRKMNTNSPFNPSLSANIPALITNLDQWLVWKLKPRTAQENKFTKVPYDLRTALSSGPTSTFLLPLSNCVQFKRLRVPTSFIFFLNIKKSQYLLGIGFSWAIFCFYRKF